MQGISGISEVQEFHRQGQLFAALTWADEILNL
jgi:hypothetical protein